MNTFSKNAGRVLSSKEAKAFTDAYRERKVEVGLNPNEYIRSEFFGINQVMQLLEQPGCVGLRIHQAKRWEDADGKPTEAGKGQLVPRVLLTGVDAKGNDMPVHAGKVGMKDMPDGDGGGGAVGDGLPCPRHCAGSN